MRFRTTLILGLVLIGLAAYVYFVEFERAEKETVKEMVLELDPAGVTAVKLTYPGREISLDRTDEGWHMTAPIEASADDRSVDNLLRAVAEAEAAKVFDDVGEDLAPYGLDHPSATVEITLKEGEVPALMVGKKSPVGNSTYVQRSDGPAVYMTGGALHTGVDKQPNDLRDKRVLVFDDGEVEKITLASGGSEIVLARSDEDWVIEQPRPYRADATNVRSLLSTLRSLRATDFASGEPSELEAYGLDSPRRTVSLSLRGEKQVDLLIGDEKDTNQLYAKNSQQPTVFIVGSWVDGNLDKDVSHFRDKTVLSFEPEGVAAVQVERADGESFVLSRTQQGGWTMEGAKDKLEETKVEDFVKELSNLKGYEIAEEDAQDLGEYGLASPIATIELRGPDDQAMGTIRFGSYTPEPPKTEYTAAVEGSPTVFHIREYLFNRANKKKSDLLPTKAP